MEIEVVRMEMEVVRMQVDMESMQSIVMEIVITNILCTLIVALIVSRISYLN